MDFLKLLPILFIAHQPSSLVETRVIDQTRQLLPIANQPDFVPVYIATGNNPPDVEALEAFYRKEAAAVVDGKNKKENEETTVITLGEATVDVAGNIVKSESSTTEKVDPENVELLNIKNAESSTQPNTETAKPDKERKVTQYEVTEEQLE